MDSTRDTKKTYHSEFLMYEDRKKMRRDGWKVASTIRYADGSIEVHYVK